MQTPTVEEDEIDLRPYIATILRRWKLIAAITAIAAGAAAAVSLAAPTQYEATSTAAIAPAGAQPTPQAKAYTDLATSDAVVAPLAQELASSSGGAAPPPAELKSKLRAATGSEPRLVTLAVRDTDPDRAARIASAWAPLFARVANSTLNSSRETLADLQGQAAAAREQLRQAEEQVAAQERSDGVADLAAQAAARQKTLQDLYATKAALPSARERLAALRSRAASRDPSSPADPADELAAMQVAARLVGENVLLPAPGAVAGRSAAALAAYLDGLARLIDERSAAIDGEIAAARTALLETQARLQAAQDAQSPLVARRDGLRQMVADLEKRAAQIAVALQAGANQVRPVGEAPPQATALPRGTARNAAVAAMLGLMVGVAAAFGVEWLAGRRRAGAVVGAEG